MNKIPKFDSIEKIALTVGKIQQAMSSRIKSVVGHGPTEKNYSKVKVKPGTMLHTLSSMMVKSVSESMPKKNNLPLIKKGDFMNKSQFDQIKQAAFEDEFNKIAKEKESKNKEKAEKENSDEEAAEGAAHEKNEECNDEDEKTAQMRKTAAAILRKYSIRK